MQRDTFEQSLWSALAPTSAELPPAQGLLHADVTIIGAGVLGLSAALALAEAGCSILVVEAEQIAFGASGRNTGFVVPSLKGSLSLAQAAKLVGPAKADSLLRAVGPRGQSWFSI